jgi:hypothetical protein
MSSQDEERQDGGSAPKRERTDAMPQLLEPSLSAPLADQAAEISEGGPPPSVLPKTLKQCYCLACGETSTHQFKSAPVGRLQSRYRAASRAENKEFQRPG